MSTSLRSRLERGEQILAPLVLSPLMARLAQSAGFDTGYVGGGALGFWTCITEANLDLTQLTHVALDLKAQASLALILDGACGFGDPMHVRNTVRAVEAVGCAAIEIEDQILPKRAHHHIGVEHVIGLDLMVAKIETAVAARRDPDFLIIGRTNAARSQNLDEALRRGEALHRAGADILLIMPRTVEDLPSIAARMPRPLMYMLPGGGIGACPLAPPELFAMGFSLLVDSGSPLLAMHRTLRRSYAAIKAGRGDPLLGGQAGQEEALVHQTIGLDDMLAIERATVEPDPE